MTAIKKVSLFITVVAVVALVAVFAVTTGTGAYAFADSISAEPDEFKNLGHNLDGFDASIAYCAYTLNTSGIYFAYEVTLDKDFLLQAGTVEGNVYHAPSLLDDLENTFIGLGYKTEQCNGRLVAYIEFESMSDYYIASGRDGYEVSDGRGERKSGFLYTDYYSSFKTVFDGIETSDNMLSFIRNECIKLGAESEKIEYVYVYGTPYKTISSDADVIKYDYTKSIYLHSFKMTSETTDREAHLTNHSPNAWAFYLLATIAALGVIAVPLTVMIVKRKKKSEGIDG